MVGTELCATCGGGDSLPGNEILLCDGLDCGQCYHQKCHSPNVAAVPENEWLCAKCVASGNVVDPEAIAQMEAQKAAEAEAAAKAFGRTAGGFDGRGGDMLMCNGCLDRCHMQCLEKPLEKHRERWEKWRCLGCKLCEGCGQDGMKIRLAVCDVCDRAHHIGCLDPPLKSWPARAFRCPSCVKCTSCGTTDAKQWTKDYRMCEPCGKQFKDKKYCPICMQAHRADEDQMIQCDKCTFWVHARCDSMDRSAFEALAASDDPYACPNCRGERTETLLLQVLDEVDKEDRHRYFAEPVSIEYALHTQYHTVVTDPMDFKTMRGKIKQAKYGTDMDEAVAAFRSDFELTCRNAMAFHRPNDHIHIMAKRMLRFGSERIRTTFPLSGNPDDAADGKGGKGGKGKDGKGGGDGGADGKGGAKSEAEPGTPGGSGVPPALESEWDYGAAVRWEFGDAGAQALDACFVCGAGPHWGSGRPEEAELLTCNLCAESFHTFCAPHPTPCLTEETRLNWVCQRCRPAPPPPKGGVGGAAGGAPLLLGGPVEMRCTRCDKRRVGAEGLGGQANWVCSECRQCEGCGSLTARSWSSDGVWCSACAPAGLEGRYCGVCSKVYDNDADESQAMIGCDRCSLWVHLPCDNISAETMAKYARAAALSHPGPESP
jgi:hypothetical protein